MSSKSTSENNGMCVQFSQHVWKKDVCKNCSKPQSAHKSNTPNSIPIPNAGNNPVTKTQNLKCGEKPVKPNKKPSLSKTLLSKQVKNEVTKPVQPIISPKPFIDPIYDIYDVSEKGKSGKPVNFDEMVGMDDSSDSPCLMATPYTVVDVITSTLEKNRQALQQKPIKPPIPPNIASINPAQKSFSTKMTNSSAALIQAELQMKNQKQGNKITSTVDIDINNKGDDSATEIDDYDLNNWNSVSPEHYKARLYEEIDDMFMQKVEGLKNNAPGKNKKEENKEDVKKTTNKTNKAKVKTADKKNELVLNNSKAKNAGKKDEKVSIKNSKECLLETPNEKSIHDNSLNNGGSNTGINAKMTNSIKHETPRTSIELKKTEKKSFLKRLLGKSSKSIEGSDNTKLHPIIKNNSLSDILDSHDSLGQDDARYKKKFSQGDLISQKSVDVFSDEVASVRTENEASSRASLSTPNGRGVDLGGSGTSFSGTSGNHNDSLHSSAHDLKPAKFSLSSDDLDSVDDKKTRSPSASSAYHPSSVRMSARNHPQFISATMRRPSHHNRKSMTAAETRITRRMLLAPPPPPPSTSPTQLSTSSFSTATLNRPAVLCKKRPDLPIEFLNPQPTTQGETVENKNSLLDGFMADLDAILMKGGVSIEVDSQSKSLPRLHPVDQLSRANSAPKGVETLPLTFAPSDLDPNKSLQQRALPEIPPSTPQKVFSQPTAISPDNDGLYEVLPNVQSKRPQIEPPGLPADKPRPAPRPAIRSVTMTTRQKRREGGVRGRDGSVEDSSRVCVKLNDSMEEQFKKMSILSLDSLHSFLEQLQQLFSSPLLNRCSQEMGEGVVGEEKEQMGGLVDGLMEWMKKDEGSVIYWRRCVFFQVDSFQENSFIIMVRQATVLCLPLPSYSHANLVRSVCSFERTLPIPRCSHFFQDPSEHHYKIDILPYSTITSLPTFTQSAADKNLYNKQILVLFLQVLDSLLHLHRLGAGLSRLQSQDIFILTKAGADKNSAGEVFPILIPTELEETASSTDQQDLISDLLQLLQMLISCNHSTEQLLNQKQQAHQATPKFRSNGSQSLCEKDTRFFNCLCKVVSFLKNKCSSAGQWADVEVLRNVLEFSLWGPESSEEDIRLAFIDPKRRQFFSCWLSCARHRVLNELILHHLPTSSKARNTHKNDLPLLNQDPSKTHTSNYLKSLLNGNDIPCSGADFHRLREASYLSKCTLDLLLDAAKLLYF